MIMLSLIDCAKMTGSNSAFVIFALSSIVGGISGQYWPTPPMRPTVVPFPKPGVRPCQTDQDCLYYGGYCKRFPTDIYGYENF